MKYAVVALLALLALSSTAQITRTPAQIEDMFTAEVVASHVTPGQLQYQILESHTTVFPFCLHHGPDNAV